MEPDDLYGLPFDRFVPERTALAKALRAGKRRDEAAAVATLRKPSVAAWAVNQLVRTQGSAVADLYEAGDALRSAQADLLAGTGDGRALRAAGERERAAVDALVERARGLLSSEGQELSATVVERVAETLHAAALDESAREQLRSGCLERELRHVGLGLGESPTPAPAARPATPASAGSNKAAHDTGDGAAKPKVPGGGAAPKLARDAERAPQVKSGAQERAAERERLEAQRAEQARRQRERDEARKAARAAEAAARRQTERAVRALRNAEERRDRAARALAEAEDALATAREEAHDADAEHERARAEPAGEPG